MDKTKEPLTIDDLSWMLGREPIKRPQPITIAVRKITICPCCRMPHPADVPCKPIERHDNGGF